MSDTPRTDAREFAVSHSIPYVVYADFARILERELSKLKALNKHYKNKLRRLKAAQENSSWKQAQ